MSILPPELEANYEILEEMHEGGMGAVYKARHRHLDEPCVIKVMHAKLKDVSGARERFFSEAKKGKQLRHHNIAEVLAFFVATDGKAYLVMEYVAGTNLRDLLAREGPLETRLAVTVGVQALSALAYLHSRNIIHRDISPDNLMLSKDATGVPLVKLIDLGIAKSLDETMNLTGTGFFIGKVSYASPEQFLQHADARSDLYSLGVVLYELLTGARPVRETDTMAIIAASQRDEPARPFSETDPRGRVPEALRSVVLKAIEKKPEKRFQTADDFADALRRTLSDDHTTVVSAAAASQPVTDEFRAAIPTLRELTADRQPRALQAVAAVLLAILAAVIGFSMLRDGEADPALPPVVAAVNPTTADVTVSAGKAPTRDQRQAASDAITRGKKLASAGKMNEAYAAFGEATSLDPSNAFGWANLGGAAALVGRPGEARAACERALRIDGDNWLAHYNLACHFTGAGEREEALRHLEITVKSLKQQARSRDELNAVMNSIRADDALGELRNDSRFAELLAAD